MWNCAPEENRVVFSIKSSRISRNSSSQCEKFRMSIISSPLRNEDIVYSVRVGDAS